MLRCEGDARSFECVIATSMECFDQGADTVVPRLSNNLHFDESVHHVIINVRMTERRAAPLAVNASRATRRLYSPINPCLIRALLAR